MAKILIASIGTGQRMKDGSLGYEGTSYFQPRDRDTIIKTPMIISALTKLYSPDKLIIIGTAGSDWPFLYEYLHVSDDENLPCIGNIDNEYYSELSRIYDDSKKGSLLSVEEMHDKLTPLKDVLGSFCERICVLHYGLNNEELMQNFERLHGLASLLNDGDEVYFDISHSFRSLPFYELLVVNLAKQTLKKNVRIASVSYGMWEARALFDNCSPIVDLSLLVNIMEWMKAVEEFDRFGTAYLLADLLDSNKIGFDISNEERKALKRLGDTVTGVEFDEFRNLVKNCVKISSRSMDAGNTQLVIGHIFRRIADTFGAMLDNDIELFAALARWHYSHKRYITCAVVLDECLFDFCASLIGKNRHGNWEWKQDELPFRYKVYNAASGNSRVGGFIHDVKRLNSIRNHLAHGGSLSYLVRDLPLFTDGMRNTVSEQLNTYTKHFSKVIGNFLKNADDLDDLKKAIVGSSDTRYLEY